MLAHLNLSAIFQNILRRLSVSSDTWRWV